MTFVPDTVPANLWWYFNHPGAWEGVKRDILEHPDPSCESLPHVWLGRGGGVTCPMDIGICDDCGVTFYNEGLEGQYGPGWKWGDPILQTVDPEDGEEYDATLCACCGRRRRQ